MKTKSGFIPLLVIIIVVAGTLSAGGGVYYAVTRKKAEAAARAQEEKNAAAEALQREKETLDRKIEELETRLTAASDIAPKSGTGDGNQEALRQLKAELEAVKKQKNTVVEKIVVEQAKEASIPETVSPPTGRLTKTEVVKKIKPAVVAIEFGTEHTIAGSGFIADPQGYVITNAHVLGVGMMFVKMSDGAAFRATTLKWDEKNDIAILKIKGAVFPAAELGDSDAVNVGDDVYAFGYPFGLKGDVSFKEGALSRRVDVDGKTYLEMSTEIHPGNSGGPLVDDHGRVIGITSSVYGQQIAGRSVGETIKLAMPVNGVKSIVNDVKAVPRNPGQFGEAHAAAYERFNLGITRNMETIEKGVQAFSDANQKLKSGEYDEASVRIAAAVAAFDAARTEANRWRTDAFEDMPLMDLAREIAIAQLAYASDLGNAADYAKTVTSGYASGNYRVVVENTPYLEKALVPLAKDRERLTALYREIDQKTSALFY